MSPLPSTHPLFYQVLMLSLNDLNWIEVGLFSRALFFGLFGVVRTGSELFFILTLLVLCGPVVPRIKSYLSKSVDPRHSSDLFAALAGIDAIRYCHCSAPPPNPTPSTPPHRYLWTYYIIDHHLT